MDLDSLIESYEAQYKALNARMDALRPLLCVYTGKDLYLLRRRLKMYYELACECKNSIATLQSYVSESSDSNEEREC